MYSLQKPVGQYLCDLTRRFFYWSDLQTFLDSQLSAYTVVSECVTFLTSDLWTEVSVQDLAPFQSLMTCRLPVIRVDTSSDVELFCRLPLEEAMVRLGGRISFERVTEMLYARGEPRFTFVKDKPVTPGQFWNYDYDFVTVWNGEVELSRELPERVKKKVSRYGAVNEVETPLPMDNRLVINSREDALQTGRFFRVEKGTDFPDRIPDRFLPFATQRLLQNYFGA